MATSVAAQAQATAKAAAGPAGLGGAGLGKGLPPQPNTLPTVALELTREELEEVRALSSNHACQPASTTPSASVLALASLQFRSPASACLADTHPPIYHTGCGV